MCSVSVFAYDKKCRPRRAGSSVGAEVQSRESRTIASGETVTLNLGFVVEYGEATFIVIEVENEELLPKEHTVDSGSGVVLRVTNVGDEPIEIKAYDMVGTMYVVEPVHILDIQGTK